MAVTYAVRLNVQDASGASASIESVADVVGRWAKIGDPLRPREEPGFKGGSTITEVLGDPTDEEWGWRLRVVHPDARDKRVIWSVQVAAVTGGSTTVDVSLGRTLTGGSVERTRGQVMPPGCIAALVSSRDLRCPDGGRALSTEVWVVDPAGAAPFAEFVLSPERKLPVIAITQRDEDVIDGGRLLPQIVGLCHVAVVLTDASWELDTLLPRGLNVYGGAARIWWPQLTAASSRWDHDLWTGDMRSSRIESEVVQVVTAAGLSAATVDPRLVRLQRRQREARDAALVEELDRVRNDYRLARERQIERAGSPEDTETEEARARVREVQDRTIATLIDDRDNALELATEYEQTANDALERARVTESERDFLRTEVKRLRGAVEEGLPLASDADPALEADIATEVRSRGDVDGARPRDFKLGPVFAITLDQHGDRYRSKALRACADLILNSPGLMGRRDDHALRTGDGANDPQRKRSSDGALARRCYLENNTASARRLHYWQLSDGSIEFASVNLHEDMNIPE